MLKGDGQAQRESYAFGKFKSFIRGQFPGLCLPSGQSSCFVSLQPLVNLSQDLPLGCAHLSQDGSQSEDFWEEQDSFWPGIIL